MGCCAPGEGCAVVLQHEHFFYIIQKKAWGVPPPCFFHYVENSDAMPIQPITPPSGLHEDFFHIMKKSQGGPPAFFIMWIVVMPCQYRPSPCVALRHCPIVFHSSTTLECAYVKPKLCTSRIPLAWWMEPLHLMQCMRPLWHQAVYAAAIAARKEQFLCLPSVPRLEEEQIGLAVSANSADLLRKGVEQSSARWLGFW